VRTLTGVTAREVDQPVVDQVWTVPNALSVLRLVLVPVFAWLIVARYDGWALLVLAVSGASDYLDGTLARRWGQVSRLGQLLDELVGQRVAGHRRERVLGRRARLPAAAGGEVLTSGRHQAIRLAPRPLLVEVDLQLQVARAPGREAFDLLGEAGGEPGVVLGRLHRRRQ